MVYYYNLPVHFPVYYVLQKTFLAIIFQSHLRHNFLPVIKKNLPTLLMIEIEENWRGGAVLISREKHDGFHTVNMH